MTFYLSGAGAYLFFLLVKFFGDAESDKSDRASWLVIAIASGIWFVAIPISILEITAKRKTQAQLDTMSKPTGFGSDARYIKTVQQVDTEDYDEIAEQSVG